MKERFNSKDGTFNSKDETTDDLTRRQWLLRLGEMVALFGVSGVVPELTLPHLEPALSELEGRFLQGGNSSASTEIALPPGLYDPSEEHLVHALASAKFTPPPGSETDFIQPNARYDLKFFSPEEFRVLTRFVEILLGDVDPNALTQTTHWLDLYLHSSVGVRDTALHLEPPHRILAVQFYGEDEVRELETS